MTRFRAHNIPMPRTAEGDRLRELIRKVYPRPNLPPVNYEAIELRILAQLAQVKGR